MVSERERERECIDAIISVTEFMRNEIERKKKDKLALLTYRRRLIHLTMKF